MMIEFTRRDCVGKFGDRRTASSAGSSRTTKECFDRRAARREGQPPLPDLRKDARLSSKHPGIPRELLGGFSSQLHPGRRVVARFLLAARPAVDARAASAGPPPPASTADGPAGSRDRAASSRRCNPRRCRACPRSDGARAARRSSPGGRSAATTAAPRAASPRHCAVARAEKTSRSSGTTFQSPHSTAGRSSAISSAAWARRRSIQRIL